MITRDAQFTDHPAKGSAFGADDGKLTVFSEILRKLEESNSRDVVPVLKKIEINTSSLLSPQNANSQPVTVAVANIKRTSGNDGRLRDDKGRFVSAKAQPPVSQANKPYHGAMMAKEGQIERDAKGRFLSKSQLALDQQSEKKDQKAVVASIKSGFASFTENGKGITQSGTVEEATGKAISGPLFESAMEIKEAVDGTRSEDSLIGKTARKIGQKAGFGKKADAQEITRDGRDEKGRFVASSIGKPDKKVADVLNNSEKADAKRHKELIKAIQENGGGGGNGDSGGMDLPDIPLKTLGGLGKLAKPLMGLARLSGPALALAGAGAAGYAAGTGINALLNKIAEAVSGKKGYTVADAVYDNVPRTKSGDVRDIIGAVESRGGDYGAYQNKDSGIVSGGKYQFTAAGGQNSSLASVFEKYAASGGERAEEARGYASIMKKGGQAAESLRNNEKLRSFITKTGNDTTMRKAQEDVFNERYFNPAIGYAQKQGINTIKMPKLTGMMVDTKIQGGMEDVTKRTSARLAAQGKNFQTASEDEIMDVFTDERKKRLDRVASGKARKGDAKSATVLASSKSRVDSVHEMLDKNEASLHSGASSIADAVKKEREAGTEAQPATQEPKSTVAVASFPKKRGKGKGKSKAKGNTAIAKVTPKKEIAKTETALVEGEATQTEAAAGAQAVVSSAAVPVAPPPEETQKRPIPAEASLPEAPVAAAPAVAMVMSNPVADARTHRKKKVKAKLAQRGVGSLAATPIAQPVAATAAKAEGGPAKSIAESIPTTQPTSAAQAESAIPAAPAMAEAMPANAVTGPTKEAVAAIPSPKPFQVSDVFTGARDGLLKADKAMKSFTVPGAIKGVRTWMNSKTVSPATAYADAKATTPAIATAEAKPATTIAEPVKAIAGQIESKPIAQPERLNPAMVAAATQPAPAAAPSGNQDIAKLTASLSQLASNMEPGNKGKESQIPNPMNIRTEFDDTMLTLMAYDRA